MRNKRQIPHFDSEDEEREFWSAHDSTEYLDWDKARKISLSKLNPSTKTISFKTISLRLPELLLEHLKLLANKRDVPYQSLLKIFLTERINQELYELQRSPRDCEEISESN